MEKKKANVEGVCMQYKYGREQLRAGRSLIPKCVMRNPKEERLKVVRVEQQQSRPKIRVVHVFAPEIIKTDAANFREVVQRLTGKPATTASGKIKKKRRVCLATTVKDVLSKPDYECERGVKRDQMEEKINVELCMEKRISGSDLCREFGEIDGFLQELSGVPFAS
ncbi:VQ motif-containing protein 25-like [Canna indica]|uniref:VQ motif-containing protein 25-like n=1 Tax=Canna indica TaxID=4628 RepID=A0AAQ3KQC1_9LILI|nr:VQ motif-containing protein 25-like [Canna indica]